MKQTYSFVLYSFIILVLLALTVALVMHFIEPSETNWVVTAIGLALTAVWLGFTSFVIALRTERAINTINLKLEHVEQLQQDIQKELKEKEESRSPIVTSLQALSQYYQDYLAKQKPETEGGKKQN